MQSTISKIIVGLIVVVVIGGAAAIAFFLLSGRPVDTTGTDSQTQSGTVSDNQTTVTNSSSSQASSQTQSQPPVDISGAYANLFTQLLAKPLVFEQANASSTGDLKSIYAFYAEDIAGEISHRPSGGPYSIDVALVDITNDDIAEALVYENLVDFCGSGGCPFDMYQKKSGKWTKIYSNLVGGDIGVSNVLTNGYLDLFLSVGGSPAVDRYVWDGKKYQSKETVALWTGTGFQVAQ